MMNWDDVSNHMSAVPNADERSKLERAVHAFREAYPNSDPIEMKVDRPNWHLEDDVRSPLNHVFADVEHNSDGHEPTRPLPEMQNAADRFADLKFFENREKVETGTDFTVYDSFSRLTAAKAVHTDALLLKFSDGEDAIHVGVQRISDAIQRYLALPASRFLHVCGAPRTGKTQLAKFIIPNLISMHTQQRVITIDLDLATIMDKRDIQLKLLERTVAALFGEESDVKAWDWRSLLTTMEKWTVTVCFVVDEYQLLCPKELIEQNGDAIKSIMKLTPAKNVHWVITGAQHGTTQVVRLARCSDWFTNAAFVIQTGSADADTLELAESLVTRYLYATEPRPSRPAVGRWREAMMPLPAAPAVVRQLICEQHGGRTICMAVRDICRALWTKYHMDFECLVADDHHGVGVTHIQLDANDLLIDPLAGVFHRHSEFSQDAWMDSLLVTRLQPVVLWYEEAYHRHLLDNKRGFFNWIESAPLDFLPFPPLDSPEFTAYYCIAIMHLDSEAQGIPGHHAATDLAFLQGQAQLDPLLAERRASSLFEWIIRNLRLVAIHSAHRGWECAVKLFGNGDEAICKRYLERLQQMAVIAQRHNEPLL